MRHIQCFFQYREVGFYYGHSRNRFFKLLAAIYDEEEPISVDERKAFLIKHKIALYDVIYECDITGSSDSSIKNVVPINVKDILKKHPSIKRIYTTGQKAKSLYDKYLYKESNIEAIPLPSSSPANATVSFEKLLAEYKRLLLNK